MLHARNTALPIAIILASFSAPAAADSLEGDRFSLSLGVFLTDRDTDTRLDSSVGDGTELDLEDDLGLSSSESVFRLDGYYRFSERHRVDFSTFDLSRNSTAQIQRDIQWGDTLYAIDTVVESNFDLSIYKAAYTYSFMNSDDGYLGASLGLYVADAGVGLVEQNIGQAEVGDLTAPLPVIGLRGQRNLSENWTVRASAELFFLEVDNIDGSLVDFFIGVDYAILDHVSIGAGFNSVNIDVKAKQNDFAGELNWQYNGGLAYLKFDF
ncbi:MAG: hypothetical protein ACR2QT_10955 [Woeseiaceae bacterium]